MVGLVVQTVVVLATVPVLVLVMLRGGGELSSVVQCREHWAL